MCGACELWYGGIISITFFMDIKNWTFPLVFSLSLSMYHAGSSANTRLEHIEFDSKSDTFILICCMSM